jgi:hypothetical protein
MQQNTFLQDFQKRTQIDFSAYQTTELIEKITEVFATVPKFQMMVIFPVLLGIVVDIAFVLLKSPHNVASILFCIVFLGFSVVVGGGLGFYFASSNLLEDINAATKISIETTEVIYQDLHKNVAKATQQEIAIPKASEVLKAVILGLILPILSKYAIEKAGFLAKSVFWVIEKVLLQVLTLISKFIEEAVDKLPLQKADTKVATFNEKIGENAEKLQAKLQKLQNIMTILDKAKTQIAKYTGIAKKVVAVPTLTIVSIFGGISGFLLLILYIFM